MSLHSKVERLDDRVKPEPSRKSPEAWREGDHDDLVLSVALACWAGEEVSAAEDACDGKAFGLLGEGEINAL